jgi:hypothetical protein
MDVSGDSPTQTPPAPIPLSPPYGDNDVTPPPRRGVALPSPPSVRGTGRRSPVTPSAHPTAGIQRFLQGRRASPAAAPGASLRRSPPLGSPGVPPSPATLPPSLSAPVPVPLSGPAGPPELGAFLAQLQAQVAATLAPLAPMQAALSPLLSLQSALTQQLAAAEASQRRFDAALDEMATLRLELRSSRPSRKRSASAPTSDSEADPPRRSSDQVDPAAVGRHSGNRRRSPPPNA